VNEFTMFDQPSRSGKTNLFL